MNLSLYIEKLYHKKPTIIKTNLGLTNDVYKLIIDDKVYALRVPKDDISNIVGLNERNTLDLICNTGLDVSEVYYDLKTRIRITKWIEDCIEFKDNQQTNKYIIATRLIKKLHSYQFKVNYEFNVFEMYLNFKNGIINPLFNYDDYEYIFDEFKNLKHEKILCHNDIVSGNILFSKDRAYLIDYEYAGMNHPYFDLMSFISENNIDDENIRNIIYKEYFGNDFNENILKELTIIENMQNLLWAAWANMLYNSRNEEIYLEIFNDKIHHLLRGLK